MKTRSSLAWTVKHGADIKKFQFGKDVGTAYQRILVKAVKECLEFGECGTTGRAPRERCSNRASSLASVDGDLGAKEWTLNLVVSSVALWCALCVVCSCCQHRSLGWEQCGHGIMSRPRVSAEPLVCDAMLGCLEILEGPWRGFTPLACWWKL